MTRKHKKVSTAAAIAMLKKPAVVPSGAAVSSTSKSKRSLSTGPVADCARMLAAKRWGKPWPPVEAPTATVSRREPEVIEAEFVEATAVPRVHPSWTFVDFNGRTTERPVLVLGEALLDDPFRDRVGARKVEKYSLGDNGARVGLWIARHRVTLTVRLEPSGVRVGIELLDARGNAAVARDVVASLERPKSAALDEVAQTIAELVPRTTPRKPSTPAKPPATSALARVDSWRTVPVVALPRSPIGPWRGGAPPALPMGLVAAIARDPEPAVDLVVSHSLEEGTTITGNTKPWASAIKDIGMGFKWFAPKRLWYRQQSRGRAAPSLPLERIAERLRSRGATVRVEEPELIDVAEAHEFRAELLRDRADQLEARAERRAGEGAAKHAAARQLGEMIPLGQPILVGHHSEARARRDAQRIHNWTGQGVELQRDAERLLSRARSAEARADRADAQAEIARNRDTIDVFVQRFGELLKKGMKSQASATSVRLFANNTGDVTWLVGFNGAHIPIFMEWVKLDKASRSIRVAERTVIDASAMTAEQAFVAVRNVLAKLNRVAIDPTMPAPDLRPSQKGSGPRSAAEQVLLEKITRAMSSPAVRLAMGVSYGKRTVRGKDRYRWTLQGGGTGMELTEVFVDLERDGDDWRAVVERYDQPGIQDRIDVDGDAQRSIDAIARAVRSAMFRSGEAIRARIRSIPEIQLPDAVTQGAEGSAKLSPELWELRHRYTNVTGWLEAARRWLNVVGPEDRRWLLEWIELVGRLPNLLDGRRTAEFDALIGVLLLEWNDDARAARRERDIENARRLR
jgi:hypothetical protein